MAGNLASSKSRAILEPKTKNAKPAAPKAPTTVVADLRRVTRASRKRAPVTAEQQRERVKILQGKENCSKR